MDRALQTCLEKEALMAFQGTRSSGCLVLVVIAALLAGPAAAQNLVRNGTFDFGVEHWNDDGDTVAFVQRPGDGSTLPGGSGPGALEVRYSLWNGTIGGPWQDIQGVVGGMEYEVAASYFYPGNPDNVADRVVVVVSWLSEFGTPVASQPLGAFPPVQASWTRLEATAIAPGSAARARLTLGVGNPAIPGETRPGIAYFDDVVFAEAGASIAVQELFVPVAASRAGMHGTYWTSDLWVVNLHEVPVTLHAAVLHSGTDNSAGVANPTALGTLGPGEFLEFADVLGTLNEHVTGGLFLRATAQAAGLPPDLILVTSRNATPNPGGQGGYGQGLLGVEAGKLARTLACGVFENVDQRTNVGVLNTSGSNLAVAITVRNENNQVVGEATWNLKPYEHRMRNVSTVAGTPVNGGVVVFRRTSPQGSFQAFVSIVDNHTGDSVYVPAR